MNRIKLIAVCLLALAPASYAAETHTRNEFHEVRSINNPTLAVRHPTRQACEADAEARGVAEGANRTSGSNTYSCHSVTNFVFTFRSATTGTPPTPTELKITPVSPTSNQIEWTASAGAGAYEIQRCEGARCTNFTTLSCFTGGTSRLHGSLKAATTYRYRIRASNNSWCNNVANNLSPYTSAVAATTLTTVPNPPDPDPDPEPVTGAAVLSWTPPTQMTDGTPFTTLRNYRILYGTSPTNLDRNIETPAGPLSTYTIRNLTPGTYYFAIRAISGGGSESSNSNIVQKTIR